MTRSVAIIGTRGYPSYYGGFETAVRKLAPYLVREGWDVTVYSRPGGTKEDDPEIDPGVRTVYTRGVESKSLSTLSYGFTSSRHAVRSRPDVALVMNVANGYFLRSFAGAGIPTLVNVDGIEWDRAKWGKLAKRVFLTGAKLTAKHGTQMVYDSKEIARRWRQDFGTDGVFIPYGGDAPGDLPVEPGLTHRGYALMVARFVPENSVSEFLQAAQIVAKTHDVVLVGSSGYGGELDEAAGLLAARNSRVHWLGHMNDDARLLSLWQHAGAYFHGHSVGGTNPALVQAMMCGAPVVARDTKYNSEVLEGSGLLVSPRPDDIARACLRVLSDEGLQDRLSAASLRRAEEAYTWEGVCASYEQALARLVDGKRD